MGLTNEYDSSGAGLYTDENGDALDSMLIVGESPWHFSSNEKLIRLREKGTKIHPLEVNAAAGLDWEVEQVALEAALRAPYKALKTDVLNVRTDNNLVLGQVKSGYKVYQNAEAPEFMMNLVDSGELQIETALSLYGGKRVVWCFKVPEGITIGGDDQENVDVFLLLMNSHDGSVSITMAVTPIRVVCQNTLAWGLREASRVYKVRHTKNSEGGLEEARKALEIGFKYTKELEEIGARMLDTTFAGESGRLATKLNLTFQEFLDSLVPVPEPTFNGKLKQTNLPAITMAKKKQEIITGIYTEHPTQLQVKGTLWGAVQAVQFYADHVATAKYTPEQRFRRAVIANNLGAAGFAKALELV